MRLEKLVLKNFKGIPKFTFESNGKSVDIFGANESGKTTLFDALTYLLTHKDSQDRSPDSFGIKTRNGNGEVIHGLDHEVEGIFDVITLRKIYQEKWTRKKGSSSEEFDGHTVKYYVDGVPVKASEYKDAVEEIMPEELLKMLTMPDYFPAQMHWTDRRQVLFDLVGEIKDEDIISNYSDLNRYPQVLEGRTHEQQEKVLKARKRELNKEIDNIPSRIDESRGHLEDVEGVAEARDSIEQLKEKKEKLESEKADIKSGGGVSDLRVKIQNLESEKLKLKNEHQQQVEESLKAAREKVEDVQNRVDEAQSEYREAKRGYEDAHRRVKQAEQVVANEKTNIESIKARTFEPPKDDTPDTCPYCKRPMDKDHEHDHEELEAAFNAKKAKDLKKAKEALSGFEQELENAKSTYAEAEQEAVKKNGKLSQRQQALKNAEKQLKEKKDNQPDFKESDGYKDLEAQQKALEEKINNYQEERRSRIEDVDEKISAIEKQIDEAKAVIQKQEKNEKIHARIAELQQQRDEFAEELDQVEADLHLLEEFVRARSAYVTDKVNEKFELVNWRLFKEQINGGLDECCDAIFVKNGVPYNEGLNNAARIQAGLDIIQTLSNHYGKSAPVFVDNAESVTKLPDTDLQVIRLVVSPEHKKLTVKPKQKAVA